jgi:hypothetical protein
MWPYRRSGAGRREFGRLVLNSLVKSARAELEERRTRGQRLRARRALHRLRELEQALDELERLGTPLPRPWYLRRAAEASAAAAGIGAAGLLAAAVGGHAHGVLVGVLDVAMLAATIAWFAIAVARRGPAAAPAAPSHEGLAGSGFGR